jgi:hypothetical protein
MFFRYDGVVQTPLGLAVDGADIAVLTDPSNFSTQPGTPLAEIYSDETSNAATITGAVWEAGQILFTFLTTPPADVVPGSYIAVSSVNPAAYDTTLEAPYLVVAVNGNVVTVAELTNPGTYVSGGTVATSVLPNPTQSQNNGNFFFYAAAGLYGVQIYYSTVEIDLPDQGVGTLAGGSVLSVALSAPVQFVVTGSPVTTSGTLALAWATETANLVLAGPAAGVPAVPTFRSLVAADLPGGIGTVSSVGLTFAVPAFLTVAVTGSPITTSGTLAITLALANESANTALLGPTTGSAAPPTFRALVTADLPAVLVPGVTLTGATDALSFNSDNFITTAGVDATTLGTPTPTTNDFEFVRVTDVGGHAHTITCSSGKIVPAHHLVTFNGTAGSFIELEAYQGLWYPRANSGVTIS